MLFSNELEYLGFVVKRSKTKVNNGEKKKKGKLVALFKV